MEYFDRIISLGQDCGVAGSLRKLEYKDATYPFDWNITNMVFIKHCFRTNFNIFNTMFDKIERSGNGHLKFNDNIYFYHETKNPNDKRLKEKYVNRAKRLHNLCSSNKKILFIRKAPSENIETTKKLVEIIKINYPKLNFKILLINNINEKNINDKNIIHKYKEINSFNKLSNDIFTHRDTLLGYKCVYEEIQKFKSIKFKQPERKIDDIESKL